MDTRAAADGARADDRAEADTGPVRGANAVPDLSDAIIAAQSGHEVAFRTLYRAVNPGLLRYLRGLVADEAEDVASETWGQIARDLGSFRGDGTAFRAWAATIARHRALDHIRKTRRRPVTTSATDELLERGAPDDTESLALQALATDRAVALIATLPTEMAEAVLLRAVMGLDADTAGQVLGKRAGAVRTAAHRGLRRLAAALAEEAERPPSPPIQRHRMTYRDESTTERRHWTEATDA
jgi:RNA polymerase sigma-70 factor, ECF subfamily